MINRIDFGFARNEDGSIHWSWPSVDHAPCGCTLYWFGPFCLGIIRGDCE